MVAETVIAIRGLTNRFGKTVVHENLSLDVHRGEVLGVVGASGSGKSVLLRSIVGLMAPSAGQITMLGTDVLGASAADRAAVSVRTGVMFQDGALFSALTVRENVEAPMRERLSVDAVTRRALADLRIAMVGLPARAGDLFPSALSGGMRKRAGLARALSLDPEILFLDEPTAGLDPISASAFDTLLNSLRTSLGLTVFLVTHDLDTLQATCDRIAVLADRRVLATGTMAEMRDVDDAWVRSYFNGPRAHAALAVAGSS
ncbi:ATP-binding cassette domain-containing protein [Psychromarinibacter sp. C21-152]|uniref:ATP-binding cassette domain-containing protein n=1 Tax=Psychromarinibacter sediminicola TaxID=3033385 RepID=A0AAE3T8X9_9RHOB|nr:ATP-binding cassette domain-containing protein [Psychromarinibacter sediminicola]MDF0601910.1 ATP-binding cassette domain-containing protein [Psychromarinibacter sediminicola]